MTNQQRYLLLHPERRKQSLKNWYLKRKSTKPWVSLYYAAFSRCNNPKHKGYKYYGGKGIKLLMSIGDFKNLWFRDFANTMKTPSIDRIDSNGNYEVSNCRFIEQRENSRRKRKLTEHQVRDIRDTYSGGLYSHKDLAFIYNVWPSTICRVINRVEYADIV